MSLIFGLWKEGKGVRLTNVVKYLSLRFWDSIPYCMYVCRSQCRLFVVSISIPAVLSQISDPILRSPRKYIHTYKKSPPIGKTNSSNLESISLSDFLSASFFCSLPKKNFHHITSRNPLRKPRTFSFSYRPNSQFPIRRKGQKREETPNRTNPKKRGEQCCQNSLILPIFETYAMELVFLHISATIIYFNV